MIDYCQLTGFQQVMMSSGSWCRSVGHYTFAESRFPDEQALKAFVGKLHAAGILVGMHCFASKISKTDAYVTPVPDRRFWVDKRDDARRRRRPPTQTEITVRATCASGPAAPCAQQKLWEGGVDKHREVILDDEIVQYQAIGPEGKWDTFLGCKRGAWGTKAAAAHGRRPTARHYGVDGCINGYIIDQETTLLDETTSRLADDLQHLRLRHGLLRRRRGRGPHALQLLRLEVPGDAMRKFTKRPLVHMGTIMTHQLWHSFTRSGTVDIYLEHAPRRHPVRGRRSTSGRPCASTSTARCTTCSRVGEDMMPGELGWFGIWPKQTNTDGLQLDEIEYLMCKSLAYDAPISLETSFGQMELHPLTPGILEIVPRVREPAHEPAGGRADAGSRCVEKDQRLRAHHGRAAAAALCR